MQIIEKVVHEDNPVAIIQYFEKLKSNMSDKNADAFKIYEILTINNFKIVSKLMADKTIKDFLNLQHHFDLKVDDIDGKVWEINDFKNYVNENKIETRYL